MVQSSRSLNILSIAGSDNSAGAGVQGDLQTILAHKANPLCVITATTAQNTRRVHTVAPVCPDHVLSQLIATWEDFEIHAIKTGLIPTITCLETIVRFVTEHLANIPLVVDPVFGASSGQKFVEMGFIERFKDLLMPIATVITPNTTEAEQLTGVKIQDPDDGMVCGSLLINKGANAVLVKGGHLSSPKAIDVLVTESGQKRFESDRIESGEVHGTGCAYASAIACRLAKGEALNSAISSAKRYITAAIEGAYGFGAKAKHLDHFPSFK